MTKWMETWFLCFHFWFSGSATEKLLKAKMCFKILSFLRLSYLQRESKKKAWGSPRSDLQLCPKTLYPNVMGEGRGKESACRLSVCEEQIYHQPCSSCRRHSPGPAGGHAPNSSGGWAGQSPDPSPIWQQWPRSWRTESNAVMLMSHETIACYSSQWRCTLLILHCRATLLHCKMHITFSILQCRLFERPKVAEWFFKWVQL